MKVHELMSRIKDLPLMSDVKCYFTLEDSGEVIIGEWVGPLEGVKDQGDGSVLLIGYGTQQEDRHG